MSDNKTTGKVTPRKGEPSDKVSKGGLDLMALLKALRSNPLLLAAIVGGGSLGGEKFAESIGQNVQWWWIALAAAGFAGFDAVGRLLRRIDRVVDDISEIKTSLARGADRFERIEEDVGSLSNWRKAELEARIAAAQVKGKKTRSDGKLGTL